MFDKFMQHGPSKVQLQWINTNKERIHGDVNLTPDHAMKLVKQKISAHVLADITRQIKDPETLRVIAINETRLRPKWAAMTRPDFPLDTLIDLYLEDPDLFRGGNEAPQPKDLAHRIHQEGTVEDLLRAGMANFITPKELHEAITSGHTLETLQGHGLYAGFRGFGSREALNFATAADLVEYLQIMWDLRLDPGEIPAPPRMPEGAEVPLREFLQKTLATFDETDLDLLRRMQSLLPEVLKNLPYRTETDDVPQFSIPDELWEDLAPSAVSILKPATPGTLAQYEARKTHLAPTEDTIDYLERGGGEKGFDWAPGHEEQAYQALESWIDTHGITPDLWRELISSNSLLSGLVRYGDHLRTRPVAQKCVETIVAKWHEGDVDAYQMPAADPYSTWSFGTFYLTLNDQLSAAWKKLCLTEPLSEMMLSENAPWGLITLPGHANRDESTAISERFVEEHKSGSPLAWKISEDLVRYALKYDRSRYPQAGLLGLYRMLLNGPSGPSSRVPWLDERVPMRQEEREALLIKLAPAVSTWGNVRPREWAEAAEKCSVDACAAVLKSPEVTGNMVREICESWTKHMHLAVAQAMEAEFGDDPRKWLTAANLLDDWDAPFQDLLSTAAAL